MSDAEITFELMRLTALLGSGHSVLFPTPLADVAIESLTIDLYTFEDGVFVVGAAEEHRDLIGARLIAIGDLDPETVIDRIEPFIPKDNPMGTRCNTI